MVMDIFLTLIFFYFDFLIAYMLYNRVLSRIPVIPCFHCVLFIPLLPNT